MANTGRLGNNHKRLIQEMAGLHSDAEIAEKIGKTEAAVRKFRIEILGKGDDLTDSETEEAKIRRELHADQSWRSIQKKYSVEDLIYFENKYVKYMEQFRFDAWATEKAAMMAVIGFEIDNNHIDIEKRSIQDQHIKLQEMIDEEIKKPTDMRSVNRIDKFLSDQSYIATRLDKLSENKRNNQNQINNLMKSLKATRQDRIQYLEAAGKGVMGLLNKLSDPKFREEAGEEMTLIHKAVQKEKKRLAENYVYADQEISRPFLSSETVDYYTDEEPNKCVSED